MPELAVDPGDAGDEAAGLDGAKNRSRLGIDLMDLPVPTLAYPERPFGPCEPRVTATAGRGVIVASTRPVFGSIFWMRFPAI